MPRLGLGTWQVTGPPAAEMVRDALALGYRHVDTARVYGNEREVGEGLRGSGVPRDEVWLTTKVWRDDVAPDRLRRAVEGSLAALGVDRVDLLLLHWPNPAVALADTLGALDAVREEGLAGSIGVSNFPSTLLREAAELAPIACEQVEYHAYLDQDAILTAAREHGIVVTAYSPLGSGGLLEEPVLGEIADERGATPAQVALRWLLDQPGVAAVPKAATHTHRAANLAALDLAPLTEEERARVDALERGRRFIDPSFAPAWD